MEERRRFPWSELPKTTVAVPSTWSDLPLELLGAILVRLPATDHVRFSAVCASWRAAVRSRLFPPGVSEAPWLVLPDNLAAARCCGPSHAAAFYVLSERRLRRIVLPDPPIASRLCIGSAGGWLVTLTEPCELHLLNPLTGVQIPLPPVGSHHVFECGIPPFIKAVLAGNPIAPSTPSLPSSSTSSGGRTRYMVVLLSSKGTSLAVAREGDEGWTTISLRRLRCTEDGVPRRCWTATDILFHKGMLRIVDPMERTIAAWLPSTDPANLSATATRFICKSNVRRHWCYLAESSAGHLFLVARKISHFRTTRFMVLYVGETSRTTTMLSRLWDDVLFVGSNQSLVVSAREFPELRRNCVYFTGMLSAFRCFPGQRPDVGVYSLDNARIDPFTDHDWQLAWPPPIWLAPGLV